MKIFRLFLAVSFFSINLSAMQQQVLGDLTPPENVLHLIRTNINAINKSTGWTTLHMAAFYGFGKELENLLIEEVFDVNCADLSGQTALHVAAEAGQAEAVQILLASGADINAVDVNGKIALDLAIENKHGNSAKRIFAQYESRGIVPQSYLTSAMKELSFNYVTLLDCQNASKIGMKLSVDNLPYVSIAANSTLSNVSIAPSVKYIHIKPSNSSDVGTPINIQKDDLNIATNDNKYDVVIRTLIMGSILKITVYSCGEKVGEGTYLTA